MKVYLPYWEKSDQNVPTRGNFLFLTGSIKISSSLTQFTSLSSTNQQIAHTNPQSVSGSIELFICSEIAPILETLPEPTRLQTSLVTSHGQKKHKLRILELRSFKISRHTVWSIGTIQPITSNHSSVMTHPLLKAKDFSQLLPDCCSYFGRVVWPSCSVFWGLWEIQFSLLDLNVSLLSFFIFANLCRETHEGNLFGFTCLPHSLAPLRKKTPKYS